MSAEGFGRKRLTAELRESEERFHAIFSQAAVGIAQVSLDGEWLLVNSRFCEMLGYSEVELRHKTLRDITHPDDEDKSLAGRRQLLAGEISSHTMEKRYVRKDGTVFWGRLNRSLARGSDKLPIYLIAVVEDITEKILAERALRGSEQRFALAQNAARLAVWERDLSTNLISTSGEYSSVYGLPVDRRALTYEEWLRLIHPDDRERVQERGLDTLTRTNIWDEEFRIVWPDGSVHWLLGKGRVFRDADSRPVRIVGVNIDITERKQAEEHRLRLAAIVESSEDAIFCKNLDGTIISWNSGAEKLFGYTAEEIMGKPLSLLLPAEYLKEFPQILERIQSGAHLEHYEVTRMCKDGRRVEVSVMISPVKDSTGALVGSSTIARDITDRKRADAALQQSEERFRLAIKATNDAIWDIDLETGVVSWNETYSQLYGRPPETSDSWQWWIDRIYPEDRERTVGALRAAIRGDASSWTCEYRFQRVDGMWAYIYDRAYIARESSGKAWRVIGAMQDLTDRKQAEAALRESEERLKDAEHLAHVGSWHWDIKANRVTWSEEMLRILGQPQDYTSSFEGFFQALVPPDRDRLVREIRDCLAEKRRHSTEYQIARPNGDLRKVICIFDVLRDNEGRPLQMFGACQDVTDSRRAQEEAFARQKLESVGTLASGIAHDFNNLMAGVLAYSDVALEELASGSLPDAELHKIRAVAIRGAEIVRQLMIYSGQETEGLELADVLGTVEDMIGLLKVSVSKHAKLETKLGEDLPAVRASAGQLRRIVMNLVTNASEAIGDRDGVIRVTTGRATVGPDWSGVTSEGLSEGDYLQLEVSDTGCGIPTETQARVFDPFFTTKSAGHGLGLAVVQGIVRSLHGAVHLRSEPGKGTTFQILLPCAKTTAEVANGHISRTEPAARPSHEATVLVVEDEDSVRQPVSKLMRNAGFSVIEASDGSAALEAIRAHESPIDVLFLDITLPGTPGREVFEEAKRLRPEMSLIVTSAYSKDVAEDTLRGSVEHFIRKPYRLSDLMDLVRQTLP